MKRSTKEIIGAIGVLLLCIVGYAALRYALLREWKGTPEEIDDEDVAAVRDFEEGVRRDSLRQEAHWDSLHRAWAAEKAERQRLREERQQAYADSQRVWAGKRAERALAREERRAHYDSVRSTYPQKLPKGSVVDANTADTTLLRRIPGIGRQYAAKIIAYREALGGFVHPSQLDEIEGLPHGISAWFRVAAGEGSVRRININRADFKTLVHHPYLSYEQTKAIVNLRRVQGRLRSWEDLRGSGLFTDADFQRLRPYFVF